MAGLLPGHFLLSSDVRTSSKDATADAARGVQVVGGPWRAGRGRRGAFSDALASCRMADIAADARVAGAKAERDSGGERNERLLRAIWRRAFCPFAARRARQFKLLGAASRRT